MYSSLQEVMYLTTMTTSPYLASRIMAAGLSLADLVMLVGTVDVVFGSVDLYTNTCMEHRTNTRAIQVVICLQYSRPPRGPANDITK